MNLAYDSSALHFYPHLQLTRCPVSPLIAILRGCPGGGFGSWRKNEITGSTRKNMIKIWRHLERKKKVTQLAVGTPSQQAKRQIGKKNTTGEVFVAEFSRLKKEIELERAQRISQVQRK
mmetsp:Transcript_71952/g.123639  ORF Transcript_71952/g.123639 Transcript_71952/m.123639 type:complete len:119 (+) Transcript_71952:87-443(+)